MDDDYYNPTDDKNDANVTFDDKYTVTSSERERLAPMSKEQWETLNKRIMDKLNKTKPKVTKGI